MSESSLPPDKDPCTSLSSTRLEASLLSLSLNTSKLVSPAKRFSSGSELWSQTPPPKSPSRFRSPGRQTPKGVLPRAPSGDRFIPNRSATNFQRASYMLFNKDISCENSSPNQMNRQLKLRQLLQQDDEPNGAIFSYVRSSSKEALKSLPLSSNFHGSKFAAVRKVPQVPERILDAPDILNDYYLNPLDWSATNKLAVALSGHVYIWNAASGDVSPLTNLNGAEDYISAVKWVQSGNHLAIGQSDGDVAIWDVQYTKKMRVLKGHSDRATSLSWNEHVLSSGSRSGEIHHSDVRAPNRLISNIRAHQREVCGLAWSPNGKLLASGGNDNEMKIWKLGQPDPVSVMGDHKAAVKALAWCPWKNNVLASGAGTADRAIRIWNCNTEILLKSVDTKSQVCSLVWSETHRELASSHGFPNNNIVLWNYPSMTKVAEMTGHGDRVLCLCLSADGSTLISAGADETLQLWKCFPSSNKHKTSLQTMKKSDRSKVINRAGIR